MNEILITIISSLVTAIVIPLITVAGQRLISWLNTKIKNEKAAVLLTQAVAIVSDAVKAVSQSYVDGLKKAGSFDKEAQAEALNKTKAIINTHATAEVKRFLSETYCDFDMWINTQIEAALNTLKVNQEKTGV